MRLMKNTHSMFRKKSKFTPASHSAPIDVKLGARGSIVAKLWCCFGEHLHSGGNELFIGDGSVVCVFWVLGMEGLEECFTQWVDVIRSRCSRERTNSFRVLLFASPSDTSRRNTEKECMERDKETFVEAWNAWDKEATPMEAADFVMGAFDLKSIKSSRAREEVAAAVVNVRGKFGCHPPERYACDLPLHAPQTYTWLRDWLEKQRPRMTLEEIWSVAGKCGFKSLQEFREALDVLRQQGRIVCIYNGEQMEVFHVPWIRTLVKLPEAWLKERKSAVDRGLTDSLPLYISKGVFSSEQMLQVCDVSGSELVGVVMFFERRLREML